MEDQKSKDNDKEQVDKFSEMFPGINPEMLGGLGDLGQAKEEIEKAAKAWFGMEEIKGHAELFNWAIRTRFENLSTVSALAATLLVIATFNTELIALDNSVRVLLSILLLMIPGSLWGLFYETGKAADDSFKKIYSITEKNLGSEAAAKVKAVKKSSFRGYIPFIVYSAFTIIFLAIIWLIWR